jgi:hypothetical protein
VCVDKIFENHDFPKNLFRQKLFGDGGKNVRDFFQILK